MPANTKVAFFNDFTGGLNLDSPRQQLTLNESYDCLDVDFNLRGGFQQRLGLKLGATNTSTMCLLGQANLGTEYLLSYDRATGVLSTFDGTATATPAGAMTDSAVEWPRFASWNTKLYFANCRSAGSILMRTRSGSTLGTATVLTNVANNNYTAPTGGNAPLARLICEHQGFMFWGDSVEGGTRFPHRVRWSHPLQPEDFATADFFDIDMDDSGDQITALVPFKNTLLVFKKKSVWAIYGYDKDSFTPQRIGTVAGAIQQEAVTTNASMCYWWSTEGNVYGYNGAGIVPVGDRITGVVRDGLLTAGGDHRVYWMQDRLFVSLVQSNGTNRYTFVYDPRVGKRGAWTKYSWEPNSMVPWKRADGSLTLWLRAVGKTGLYQMGLPAQLTDEYTTGVQTAIAGYYSTAWFSAQDTALMKQWKRILLTAATRDPCTFQVDVYQDFDDSGIKRTLTFDNTAPAGAMLWGTGVWGSSSWGDGGATYGFIRLPSAGRSHSIRLKFSVLNNITTWWIDSFTLPFVEKSYR